MGLFKIGMNLYHYTSQAGLLGILRTKSVWVSSIRHLNDAAELTYAVRLMRKRLSAKLSSNPSSAYHQRVLRSIDAFEASDVYVGSFSEKRDLLSQWRAYAHGGVGFSVGFDRDRLKKLAAEQNFRLVQCVYDPEEQKRKIEGIVSKFTGRTDGDVRLCVIELLRVASRLKHPSFKEEKEWRLVSRDPSDQPVSFRASKSMLIPYRKFNLKEKDSKVPITRIVVGPSPHLELAINSVKGLIDSRNISGVEVIGSSVPYRHW